MLSNINDCGIIILAAGASSRMGNPKQLLQFKKHSLLQHATSVALAANANPVIVVLGNNSDSLLTEISAKKTDIVFNEKWKEGIASSIRYGLYRLQEIYPATNSALLMVCDQPFVTTALLNSLIHTQKETGKSIVASAYDDAIGTPALFHKSLFPQLLSLSGDTGARKIIQQHPEQVAKVSFPQGGIDIDTATDYERLTKDNP
jgi:molybdenum cofactor cytidylyltransferase